MSRHDVCVAVLLAAVFVAPASSQITIDGFYLYEHVGESRAFVQHRALDPTGLQAVVAAAGANQTYDFTTAGYEVDFWATYRTLSSAEGVPGGDAPHFAGANLVSEMRISHTGEPVAGKEDSTVWSFYRVAGDGAYLLGIVTPVDWEGDGTSQPMAFPFVPDQLVMKLPLMYGTAWTQTFALSSLMDQQVNMTCQVDGWGTLVTPAGSAPCLRLRQVDERSIPFFGGVVRTTTLAFLTRGELGAAVTLNETDTPIAATYHVFGTGEGGPTAVQAQSWSRVKGQAR